VFGEFAFIKHPVIFIAHNMLRSAVLGIITATEKLLLFQRRHFILW